MNKAELERKDVSTGAVKAPHGSKKNSRVRNNKEWNKNGKAMTSTATKNDSSWYIPNEQLAKDSASIPYNVFDGARYQIAKDLYSEPAQVTLNNKSGVPGVYFYKYIPAIPKTSPTSGTNMAMRALYTFVRHANAGHTNYEAPDLMLYILAVDSIYLQVHELTRLFKLAYSYSLGNRLIPKVIFNAMGIDLDTFVQNIANYRARLNQIIAKINTLAVPKNIDLFLRRSVLGNSVLTDEPNRPTQIIIPLADNYYQYDSSGSTGGKLVALSPYSDFGSSSITYKSASGSWNYRIASAMTTTRKYDIETMFVNLNACVGVLLSDEDINIMSGDILKAYGDNLFHLEYVNENEGITFTHDENFLMQFANSTTIDLTCATRDADINDSPLKFINETGSYSTQPVITQKNGSLLFQAVLEYSNGGTAAQPENIKTKMVSGLPFICLDKAPVRANKEDVTPATTLEITRLTMLAGEMEKDSTKTRWNLIHCTEIGLGWLVVTPENISDFGVILNQWNQFGTTVSQISTLTSWGDIASVKDSETIGSPTVISGNLASIHNAVLGLSFGPLPFVLAPITTDSRGEQAEICLIYGISKASEKTALIDNVTLSIMHDTAILGLFKSPYYAK